MKLFADRGYLTTVRHDVSLWDDFLHSTIGDSLNVGSLFLRHNRVMDKTGITERVHHED